MREERDKWEKEARLQYRLHNEMIEESRTYREQLQSAQQENAELRSKLEGWVELKKAQQEIERLRDVTKTLQSRLDESGVLYCEIQKRAISAEQDRDKLIEGLRWIISNVNGYETYEDAKYEAIELLLEIGVNINES